MGTGGAPSAGGPKERGAAPACSIATKYKLSSHRGCEAMEYGHTSRLERHIVPQLTLLLVPNEFFICGASRVSTRNSALRGGANP
eukprot:scaffold99551_cov31-Tisochrysis_lutea.AAC.3